MKRSLSLTFLLLIATYQLAFSQSVSQFFLGTTSNLFISSSFSLSFSVGELSVNSYLANDFLLTQGFQQAYPENASPGEDTLQVISVNPNPVKLKVNLDFYISGNYSYLIDIYTLKGNRIEQFQYPNIFYKERKTLNMENYAKGLYLIRIYSTNGKVNKMFKIEKM